MIKLNEEDPFKTFTLLCVFIMLIALCVIGGYSSKSTESKREVPVQEEQIKDSTVCRADSSICINGTTYNPVVGQTDDSPYKTAFGFIISRTHPIYSRIVGLPVWAMIALNVHPGDSVLVISSDPKFPYWGIWMFGDWNGWHNIWRSNTIDFCVSARDSMNKFKSLNVTKWTNKGR